jgi:carboxylesterase type B
MKSKREIVGVAFQYWLEAFGSLASEDFEKNDTLNARLLDQQFAHG